jgi:hypothetical protein
MSRLSFALRYWQSLTCATPSSGVPGSGRSPAGYGFWQRYRASLTAADLPLGRPALEGSELKAPGSSHLRSVSDQPPADVLVLDRAGRNERDQVPRTVGARRYWAVPAAAAVGMLAIGVSLWLSAFVGRPGQSPGQANVGHSWPLPFVTASGQAVRPVQGSYPGLGLKAVQIPVASLTSTLAKAFSEGQAAGSASVTGFEFRSSENTNLCLSAGDNGPTAGQNRDRVEVARCSLQRNEIWIPEQWEINGSRYTHLVNYQYQSECMQADGIGGMSNGHLVELWNCYAADNESWDFGDWYNAVESGIRSYPIFVQSGRFCLDADKFDFGVGDAVNIWSQYASSSQFWS